MKVTKGRTHIKLRGNDHYRLIISVSNVSVIKIYKKRVKVKPIKREVNRTIV